jgi:Putative zinc-finger
VSPELDELTCSEEAARLLPWYVAGRLSPADRERVALHLERCAVCRNDLEHETSVRALLRDTSVEYAPQAGLAKTLARIDELGRDAPAVPAPKTREAVRRWPAPIRWLAAAMVVQAIALGGLGGLLYHATSRDPAAPPYQTLSSGSPLPTGPHCRAVFVSTMTLGDLQTLLHREHLAVVDGPSESGIYTLAMSDGSEARELRTVIQTLRATSGVLFAEPAMNDAGQPR